jgi:hypothetical protein
LLNGLLKTASAGVTGAGAYLKKNGFESFLDFVKNFLQLGNLAIHSLTNYDDT